MAGWQASLGELMAYDAKQTENKRDVSINGMVYLFSRRTHLYSVVVGVVMYAAV